MSNEPPSERTCPRCGTRLAEDTAEGLCPACLLALNLATQTELPEEVGPNGTKKVPPQPKSPPSPDEIASQFPQFEILDCLGRGGMGVVYKARQKSLDRLVALKILAPEREKDPQFAERFAREARTLAHLSHPNIVTVHDFGETDGMFYLVMEFVDGVNLRHLLRERKLSPEEALAIVPPVCEALQYAHSQGVIHRDIKPENLLLDKQGRIKIADFGIAKILGRVAEKSTSAGSGDVPAARSVDRPAGPGSPPGKPAPRPDVTGAGNVIGTPQYMAPEQTASPQNVDHRADIYSLGVVLYEMLTGELPDASLQPPSKKVHVDVRIDEIVLRALEKVPERRYQTAEQFGTIVQTMATGAVKPEARGQVAEGEPRRLKPTAAGQEYNPWETTTIAVGTMVFIVLFLVALEEWSRPFRLPLIVMCIGGLGICAASIAGVWPFPSPLFPEPNFSSRNLRRHRGLAEARPGSEPRLSPTALRGSNPRERLAFKVLAGVAIIAIVLTAILFWVQRPRLDDHETFQVNGTEVFADETQTGSPTRPSAEAGLSQKYTDVGPALERAVPFGPEFEITLNESSGATDAALLDLDTGRTLDRDRAIEHWPEERQMRWLKESGADLWMNHTNWRLFTLSSNAVRLVQVEDRLWDGLGWDQFEHELTRGYPGVHTESTPVTTIYVLGTNPVPPLTYVFATAEGTHGLLQVMKLEQNPYRMKLRLKIASAPAAVPTVTMQQGSSRSHPLFSSEHEAALMQLENERDGPRLLDIDTGRTEEIPVDEEHYSFEHRADIGTRVLDAARDFVIEHQWTLISESGHTRKIVAPTVVTNVREPASEETVVIKAEDLNGHEIAFQDRLLAGGRARFSVTVPPGAEFSANRIGVAIARRLGLAAGFTGAGTRSGPGMIATNNESSTATGSVRSPFPNGPRFRVNLPDEGGLDLDSGQVKTPWQNAEGEFLGPSGMDVVWEDDEGGLLMATPEDLSVKVLALPEANDFQDAAVKTLQRFGDLRRSLEHGAPANQSRFFAVLTDQRNLAVIEVTHPSDKAGVINWNLGRIEAQINGINVEPYQLLPVATKTSPSDETEVQAPSTADRNTLADELPAQGELAARFQAANAIQSFPERDKAMAAIARDAAGTGNAALTKRALAQITSFPLADEAALDAARELVKAGHRAEAIEIARRMTSFTARDAALSELAK